MQPTSQSTEVIATSFLSRLAGTTEADRIDSELASARVALQKLPTVNFNLLHLHFIRGLSTDEVAHECGCPEAAVLRWLEPAMQAYTRQLVDDGVIAGPAMNCRKHSPRRLVTDAAQFQFPSSHFNAAEPATASLSNAKRPLHTPTMQPIHHHPPTRSRGVAEAVQASALRVPIGRRLMSTPLEFVENVESPLLPLAHHNIRRSGEPAAPSRSTTSFSRRSPGSPPESSAKGSPPAQLQPPHQTEPRYEPNHEPKHDYKYEKQTCTVKPRPLGSFAAAESRGRAHRHRRSKTPPGWRGGLQSRDRAAPQRPRRHSDRGWRGPDIPDVLDPRRLLGFEQAAILHLPRGSSQLPGLRELRLE